MKAVIITLISKHSGVKSEYILSLMLAVAKTVEVVMKLTDSRHPLLPLTKPIILWQTIKIQCFCFFFFFFAFAMKKPSEQLYGWHSTQN